MSPAHIRSKANNGTTIRESQPADARGMAECHIAAFPGRFMTEMGLHWLCALYRYYITNSGGICYTAFDTTCRVVGFAVGGRPGIRERFIRSAMLRYVHIIFWRFITKAKVRRVLLKELGKKFHFNRAKVLREELKSQEAGCGNLLSICVLPDLMGSGAADKLIETFQNACAEKGYKHLKLSVVSENYRAVAFYKKHGWYQMETSQGSTKFALDL